MKTSARNQFAGTVIGLREGDVDFEIGMEMNALVKSSSVLLLTDPHIRTSARNHLWGEVTRIRNGPVNAEITLTMPGGKTVCAVVTHDSVERLALVLGEQACAVFKASAVILCLYD